ncbi:MAG: hypothetical protein M3R30_05910 [Candidatus Eremiobacteraeota bacterium]|nr:hypothetical protein [Candidatus Eremiobacteraeota bacterium]
MNDSLGHGSGDAVMVQMAALLRSHTAEGVDVTATSLRTPARHAQESRH